MTMRTLAALLLALPLATLAQTAVPTWQREAIPFYDTVHALQGIYGHWALPRAQDFDRNARALVPAVAALCQAPAADGRAALASARTAWQATARAWEQLAAVSIGPVIARRSQRAIDFTPTRPALIEKAIATQPQGAKAFERIGTPAKGLPALALGESQEDEAEPIEILIYAHTDAGHEALLRVVTGAGGRID